MKMLPVEPLMEFVEARGGLDTVLRRYPSGYLRPGETAPPGMPGANGWVDSLRRAQKRGLISDLLVDRFCIKVMRVMPDQVYGDLWWHDREAA